MPTGLKVATVLNVVAIAILAVFAALAVRAGGGFTAGDFPPERRIVLEPVEPAPEAVPVVATVRPEIPAEYRRVEAQAPRWEEGADGRIRFID